MASEIHMPGPVCLIENSGEQLVVNQEALEILSAIEKPVVVVAIVGLYRTGKSYLMNKLAGKQKGEWYQQSSAQFPLPCPLSASIKQMCGEKFRDSGDMGCFVPTSGLTFLN